MLGNTVRASARARVISEKARPKSSGLRDVLGNASPDDVVTGQGKVWVFRNGHVLVGHWRRKYPGSPMKLVGGRGSLSGDQAPVKTVGSFWPYATTLFDYIRRAMPLNAAKSLSDDEVYAVSAYILQLNGIIGEADAMDAQTLPQVQMPNRGGFIVFSRTQ